MSNPVIAPPQSGKAITEQLVAGDPTSQLQSVELSKVVTEEEKNSLNERLRAERFGIQGAIINSFTDSVITVDPETERPMLKVNTTPRPLTRRARKSRSWLEDGPEGQGWYTQYEEFRPAPATVFDDFQEDFDYTLESQRDAWAKAQFAQTDSPVSRWSSRLVEVGKQQAALNVTEAVLLDDNDEAVTGSLTAPENEQAALADLPIENIALIVGELTQATLRALDRAGITDEAERLRALDDIVLQARDVSLHHIAHFRSGEADDVSDAPRLTELGANLVQDDNGRYRLDWQGRVKPKPKDKIFSRTHGCAAAYKIEGQPSAIERLGWAFNNELKKRGLLAPGASQQPAPAFEIPPPVKEPNDLW